MAFEHNDRNPYEFVFVFMRNILYSYGVPGRRARGVRGSCGGAWRLHRIESDLTTYFQTEKHLYH